jgi:tetratricopeptide (TPR) repeat protein
VLPVAESDGRAGWLSVPACAALAGAVAALTGQLVSPFHVPTHEFTQLFAVLAFVAVVLGGWYAARRRRNRAGDVLSSVLASVVTTGAGACATQLAVNALVHGCRTELAIAFFWLTWLPLGVFAAVLGVAGGERGWSFKRVSLVLLSLGLASAVHDVLQGLAGVRVIDPLLGEPAALDQRAGMQVTAVQVYQRSWLVGLAVVVWAVRTWRVRKSDRIAARYARFTAIAFVAGTFAAGSHVGLGWGTGRLRSELDAVLRTPHFLLRYDSDGEASLHVEAIARQSEWQSHVLSADWGETAQPIEIRVFDGMGELHDVTGRWNAHAARRWINLTWWAGLGETLPHELVHVLHLEGSWWSPLRWARRGLVEGIAVAWADDLVRLPEAHRPQAAALRAGRLPPLTQCLSIVGFWTVNERAAYEATGSFIGWLVLEHGLETFRAFERTRDYESVYGMGLSELETAWHAFLSRVEVDPDERALARERFDPDLSPAYAASACPKLGERSEPPEKAAERRFARGDFENALTVYRRLLDEDPEPEVRWVLRAATCLQRLGRAAEALSLLGERSTEGLAAEDLDQLLTRRSVSLMTMREWEALYAALEERTARAGGTSPGRLVAEECLRDPEIRGEVAEALAPEDVSLRSERLESLTRFHSERRCLRLLAAAEWSGPALGQVRIDAATRERARARLGWVRGDPAACAILSVPLGELAEMAIHRGDPDLAEELERGVVQSCSDPLIRFRATRRLDRIEWERSGRGQQEGTSVPTSSPRPAVAGRGLGGGERWRARVTRTRSASAG